MAGTYKLQILRVRDAPELNVLGGVTSYKAVDWTVDGRNVHTTRILTAEFTQAKARAAVEAEAKPIIDLLSTA
jgi:hypothetical protein